MIENRQFHIKRREFSDARSLLEVIADTCGPNVLRWDIVNVNNLAALVTPAGCLGGVPSVYAHKYGIPIIAVQENRTIFDVTQASLGLNDVIEVRNYAEAAGVVLALKAGISLESISRPLQTFRFHKETHDTSLEDAADEVAVTS